MEFSPAWLRPIIALAAATGMRRSEVFGLRWLDIDRAGGRALLPQTKNDEGRIVYLNRLALQAINSLEQKAAADPLFPNLAPECVSVSVYAALPFTEDRRLSLPRSAAHCRKLDAHAGSGHSHCSATAHMELRLTVTIDRDWAFGIPEAM
jgi:integrase